MSISIDENVRRRETPNHQKIRSGATMEATSNSERTQCEQVGHVTVIRVLDNVLTGHLAIEQVSAELQRRLQQYDSAHVVLDFARVEAISRSIISKLVEIKNLLWNRGGRLVITNVSRQLQEATAMTGIDRLFTIKQSEAEILCGFNTP